MAYTLGAAARATGKSKATISRAIKSGRLSAARDGFGGYSIEPAELHRVYPATGNATSAVQRSDTATDRDPAPSLETVALQRLIDEKDARIADQAETITDLRKRLDSLTALLPGPRAPWWRRWFRG